jgi:hypothetical protein
MRCVATADGLHQDLLAVTCPTAGLERVQKGIEFEPTTDNCRDNNDSSSFDKKHESAIGYFGQDM